MMMTLGSPRRPTIKRSSFCVARFMIWPNWVRAVRAETTLVMDRLACMMLNSATELINQFDFSVTQSSTGGRRKLCRLRGGRQHQPGHVIAGNRIQQEAGGCGWLFGFELAGL